MGFEEEVLNLAVQHAIQAHGCCDSSELREQLRSMLVEESRGRQLKLPRFDHGLIGPNTDVMIDLSN
jgi:hypothetical protein